MARRRRRGFPIVIALAAVLVAGLVAVLAAFSRGALSGLERSRGTASGGELVDDAGVALYRGFDVRDYPGDAAMRRLRRAYRWAGYYLPSPNHPSDSWAGTWPRLRDMGYGVAVLYVGQQRGDLTAEQAVNDAREAAAGARDDHFEAGTIVFLDIERRDGVDAEMALYASTWVATLRGESVFRPGVYCHVSNAEALRRKLGELTFWVAGGPGSFDVTTSPSASGIGFARAWQGLLDAPEPAGLVRFAVDVSVSLTPSPSID
jgi:hypothetical protein